MESDNSNFGYTARCVKLFSLSLLLELTDDDINNNGEMDYRCYFGKQLYFYRSTLIYDKALKFSWVARNISDTIDLKLEKSKC